MATKTTPKKSAKKQSTKQVVVAQPEKTAAQAEAEEKAARKAREQKIRDARQAWAYALVRQLDLPLYPEKSDLPASTRSGLAFEVSDFMTVHLDSCLADNIPVGGPIPLQLAKGIREFAEQLNRKAAALEAIQAATVAAKAEPEDEEDEGDQDE